MAFLKVVGRRSLVIEDLVFLGFNSRVVALNRDTGAIVWAWQAGKGRGYTTVLLDGDRLIVSVIGYTYCLNPMTGEELWFNSLSGMGTGVVSIASVHGNAQSGAALADEEARARAASASAGAPA